MQSYKLVNIGFGSIVSAERVVALISSDSSPIKRLIQEAREKGTLVDATHGRRTRAVIIADSGHVILSSIHPETIAGRIGGISTKEDSGGFQKEDSSVFQKEDSSVFQKEDSGVFQKEDILC